MWRARTHRASPVAILIWIALLLSGAAEAGAVGAPVRVAPIKTPGPIGPLGRSVRDLQSSSVLDRSRGSALAPGSGGISPKLRRGAIADEGLRRELADAETSLMSEIQRAVSRETRDVERQRALRCIGGALKAFGESYATTIQEPRDAGRPAPSPSLDDFGAGLEECMKVYLPKAKAEALERASAAVVREAKRAQDAAAASEARAQHLATLSSSSDVLARWMIDSGEAIAGDGGTTKPIADTTPAPAPDPVPEPDGESPPWGIIIGGLVAVGIGLAVHTRRRARGT